MKRQKLAWLTPAVLVLAFAEPAAPQESRRDDHPGSAVVREKDGDSEALLRIICDERGRPEAGFITEPNRITRQETGRSNSASLRLRPWQDTDDVLITTTWGVAWIPRPTSSGPTLSIEVDVGPAGFTRDGMPVAVTYDMWKAGDVPDERTTVVFEANCEVRDPDAPAWRRIPG